MDRWYEILGLEPGATPDKVKQAYRDLAKVWHPDRFLNDPRLQKKAEEKLKEINQAYEKLYYHHTAPNFQHEQPRPEPEKSSPQSEQPQPPIGSYTQTQTTTWVDRIPKWLMILIILVLIRLVVNQFNAPSRTSKPREIAPTISDSKPFRAYAPPVLDKRKRKDLVIPKHQEKPSLLVKKENLPSQDKTFSTKPDLFKESSIPERPISETPIPEKPIPSIKVTPEDEDSFSKDLSVPKKQVRNYFTIGSSQDEVLAVQGTPSRISGSRWHYGISYVDFYNSKVSSFSNYSKNLKVKVP